MLLIHGYRLELLRRGNIERYRVFDTNGVQVAYMKLEDSTFYVYAPNSNGQMIYRGYPEGYTEFRDTERMKFLKKAVSAIQKYYASMPYEEI